MRFAMMMMMMMMPGLAWGSDDGDRNAAYRAARQQYVLGPTYEQERAIRKAKENALPETLEGRWKYLKEKMGTYTDKEKRLENIADKMGNSAMLGETYAQAQRRSMLMQRMYKGEKEDQDRREARRAFEKAEDEEYAKRRKEAFGKVAKAVGVGAIASRFFPGWGDAANAATKVEEKPSAPVSTVLRATVATACVAAAAGAATVAKMVHASREDDDIFAPPKRRGGPPPRTAGGAAVPATQQQQPEEQEEIVTQQAVETTNATNATNATNLVEDDEPRRHNGIAAASIARLATLRERDELLGRVEGRYKLLGQEIPFGVRNKSPEELRLLLAELRDQEPPSDQPPSPEKEEEEEKPPAQ